MVLDCVSNIYYSASCGACAHQRQLLCFAERGGTAAVCGCAGAAMSTRCGRMAGAAAHGQLA